MAKLLVSEEPSDLKKTQGFRFKTLKDGYEANIRDG